MIQVRSRALTEHERTGQALHRPGKGHRGEIFENILLGEVVYNTEFGHRKDRVLFQIGDKTVQKLFIRQTHYDYCMAAGLDEIKGKLTGLHENSGVFAKMAKGKDKEKLGEKQAHFMAELKEMERLIARMESTVSVGVPLTESEQAAKKLEHLERDMHTIGSKVNVYVSEAKALRNTFRGLEKQIDQRVSETQFQNLSSRMSYIEKLSEELKVSKTKNILVDLLQVIQGLDKKVDAIEKAVEERMGIYSKGPGEQVKGRDTIETIEAAPLQKQSAPPKKKGIFSGITGLFKKGE